MSKSRCPYDNAAMENFFGTRKSECLHRMEFSNGAEVEQAITQRVQFYNMTGLIFSCLFPREQSGNSGGFLLKTSIEQRMLYVEGIRVR